MNIFLSALLPFLAAEADFTDLGDAITDLINSMWKPCVIVASSLAGAWGLFIGLKWWFSSGDEQKKKSAKSALFSFIIGVGLIFVIAVGAPMAIGAFAEWVSSF